MSNGLYPLPLENIHPCSEQVSWGLPYIRAVRTKFIEVYLIYGLSVPGLLRFTLYTGCPYQVYWTLPYIRAVRTRFRPPSPPRPSSTWPQRPGSWSDWWIDHATDRWFISCTGYPAFFLYLVSGQISCKDLLEQTMRTSNKQTFLEPFQYLVIKERNSDQKINVSRF